MAGIDFDVISENRKTINPKTIFYAGTIFAILIGILMFSIPELMVDPLRLFKDRDYFFDWLARTLVLIFVTIVSMLIGEGSSKDFYKNNVKLSYQTRLSEYKEWLAKVDDIAKYITDYIIWLIPRENVNNRLKYLLSIGINSLEAEYIAKYCDLNDLEELSVRAISKKDESGKDIYIMKIPPELVNGVKYALSGKVDVKDTDSTKYLFPDDEEDFKGSALDRCEKIDKKIRKISTERKVRKIVMTVMVAAIWTMFIFDANAGKENVQIAMDLMSRIMSMIGGFVAGWLTSVEVVRQLTKKLSSKMIVLKQFRSDYDDKSFVPQSYEEKAKAEYELEHKEEVEPNGIEVDETDGQGTGDTAPVGC